MELMKNVNTAWHILRLQIGDSLLVWRTGNMV